MKLFSAQKLEMQIPQENTYTESSSMPKNDNKLDEFLENHFEFPSGNLNDIKNFLIEDSELEKIIYDLPEIISKQLKYIKISFDFMNETDPNEKILEIIVYSNLNENESFQKEDTISDEIIDNYPKTTHEFIILVE